MSQIFTGNIFIFHAFDVGDEINLEQVEASPEIMTRPLQLAKYFKNYHIPLSIDLPHPHESSKFLHCKLFDFGVISLVYKIPFHGTLEDIKTELSAIDHEFQEQTVVDAGSIFKRIKHTITQPKFFHLRSSYFVIQVDQESESISLQQLKEESGGTIASLLRFETETLSESQKDEILQNMRGYYRGDMVVIDNEAAFVYDEEYEELLHLFEFVNVQQLELQYYDRKLGHQLYTVYQKGVRTLPLKAYLPFIGSMMKDPISELALLKVDISTIIERLASSIKLSGETYVSETYELLEEKLDLPNWQKSIDNKLEIIKDMHTLYQNKIDAIREDSLTILIIVLICIELIVAIIK